MNLHSILNWCHYVNTSKSCFRVKLELLGFRVKLGGKGEGEVVVGKGSHAWHYGMIFPGVNIATFYSQFSVDHFSVAKRL